jgi:HSP20 family protein
MSEVAQWRGTKLLDEARKEMESVFNRFFGPVTESEREAKHAWSPRVDVSETDKDITVLADLPGVDPKDVEITLADGMMTIKGEKKEVHEEKGKNFHKTERFVGSFFRQLLLPTGADEDKVSATSTNGTITISIPKKPSAQPKKVAIKPNA